VEQVFRQRFDEHNLRQKRYFEGTIKSTLVPKDTPYLRRHVDEVVRFAGIAPGERVLEVGCGMGRYTFILAQRGLRVEGLDLSEVLLDRLREFDSGRYNIPLHFADVLHPPEELDGQFDVVVGFFTLHHLHYLPGCFEAMARLVKPGGRIAFLEPNAFNPLYYVQIAVTPRMTWKGDGGVVKMRRKVICGAMRDAAFKDIELKRFGFFPPLVANQAWGARLESYLERLPFLYPLLPFQLFKGLRE
jgi:SAM-dependent methyltransferase